MLLPKALRVVGSWGWTYSEKFKDLKSLTASPVQPPRTCKLREVDEAPYKVAFCVTTYKRNFQITTALPVNLCITWPRRRTFTWVVVDFNSDDELQDHIMENYAVAMACGHLRYHRSVEPWESFHCPTAKNRSTMAAGDLAADVALEAIYAINVDNDNLLTSAFLDDVERTAPQQLRHSVAAHANNWLKAPEPLCAHWQSKELGTCGRIGYPLELFMHVGGYDEAFEAMAYQDIDIAARISLIGGVEYISSTATGFSVPNDPRFSTSLMAGMKARRGQRTAENAAKAACTSSPLSLEEMNSKNKAIAKERKGQVQVNVGKAKIGVPTRWLFQSARDAGATVDAASAPSGHDGGATVDAAAAPAAHDVGASTHAAAAPAADDSGAHVKCAHFLPLSSAGANVMAPVWQVRGEDILMRIYMSPPVKRRRH